MRLVYTSKSNHQVILGSCSDELIDAISVPGALSLLESVALQWAASIKERAGVPTALPPDDILLTYLKQIEDRLHSGVDAALAGVTALAVDAAANAAAAAVAESNVISRSMFREVLDAIPVPVPVPVVGPTIDQTAAALALTVLTGEITSLSKSSNERYAAMAATIEKLTVNVSTIDKNTPMQLAAHVQKMQDKVDAEYAKVSWTMDALCHKLPSTVSDVMRPVLTKMDELTKQHTKMTSNGSLKGKDGEERLFAALGDRLGRVSGDYDLTWTRSKAHSCDMKVTRMNRGDVHIEVKAYASNVPLTEVKKFHDDLRGLKTHGIMVSLSSGIVGKGVLDVKEFPGGKFVLYVSNNQYDVEFLETMLQVLYKFEDAVRMRTSTADLVEDVSVIKIPCATMKQIRMELCDTGARLSTMKVHLESALKLLSEISVGNVTKMLHDCLTNVAHKPQIVQVHVKVPLLKPVSVLKPQIEESVDSSSYMKDVARAIAAARCKV
jgi:hypothetical protein